MSYIWRRWSATFSKRTLPGLMVAAALALPALADAKTIAAVQALPLPPVRRRSRRAREL